MEVTKWLKPSGTRLLARPCRGGHPRPPNFMHFPRRNAPRTVHEPLDSHGSRCSAIGTHVQWPCLVPGLLLSPVGPEARLKNAAPSVQSHYGTFTPTTGCSAPVPRIGTLVSWGFHLDFSLCSLLGPHLTGSCPTFSSTLTTIPLYDSSLQWFEART